MAEAQSKKYLVRVPTGKGTNDFEFADLEEAFQKFCSKIAQNQATRIACYHTSLEVPKDMTWSDLLNDVIARYHDCLTLVEKMNEQPRNEDGAIIISAKSKEDFIALDRLMSHVGPAVWNTWDQISKVYWKSCIPRIRALLEEAVVDG